MNNKKTWQEIKSLLANHSEKELVNLIRDLYQSNKINQQFLNTRYASSDAVLEPFKEEIAKLICPKPFSDYDQNYLRKAKNQISQYKKAQGIPEMTAELEVFYCECVVEFLENCDIEDEPYYEAFEKMYERAVKSTLILSKEEQASYLTRLSTVYRESENWGWGVKDTLTEIIKKYSLDLNTQLNDC